MAVTLAKVLETAQSSVKETIKELTEGKMVTNGRLCHRPTSPDLFALNVRTLSHTLSEGLLCVISLVLSWRLKRPLQNESRNANNLLNSS